MKLFEPRELQKWRYIISSCIIIVNGEAITLEPMCVTGIEIMCDYFKSTFPIFKLNLMLETDVYFKLMQYKNNLSVTLNIQKYYKKYKEETQSIRKPCFHGTFITIDDSLEVNKNRDIDFKEKMSNAGSKDDTNKFNKPFEMYLYRPEVANNLKIQINDNFDNDNLSNVIGYAFGEAGIKNALVSPLENNKKYKDLYCPPLTITKLIPHLDAFYGFYKCGSMIFFDLTRSYVLNFKGGCTVYESGEKQETCILVPKATGVDGVDGGSIDKGDDKFYINCLYDKVSINNKSISENILSGSDVTIVNTLSNTTGTSKGKVQTVGKSNETIIENRYENEWLGSTFTAQSSSNAVIITIGITEFDFNALTPNKKFSFIFEDPNLTNKYKGTYMMTNLVVKFQNDTGNGDFAIIAGVELRKVG